MGNNIAMSTLKKQKPVTQFNTLIINQTFPQKPSINIGCQWITETNKFYWISILTLINLTKLVLLYF